MSEIGERVKKIVVEHLGVEPDKVVGSDRTGRAVFSGPPVSCFWPPVSGWSF